MPERDHQFCGGYTGSGEDGGCAYIVGAADRAAGGGIFCGASRQAGSAYCEVHHASCYLPVGSAAERRKIMEIEALAEAVGGTQGRDLRLPPEPLLRRLDRIARAPARANRSRYVRKEKSMAHSGKAADATRSEPGAPSAERLQHGMVERIDRALADAAGNPGRPYRAVDILAAMERRGTITSGMRQAGEDFRARFAVAQLDPLRALDLSRQRFGEPGLRRDGDGPGIRIEAARGAVWRAIQAVGGIASPGGSCLWHVIGWERTLKEWALRQGWNGRRVTQEAASGILVAALGALEAHRGRPQ